MGAISLVPVTFSPEICPTSGSVTAVNNVGILVVADDNVAPAELRLMKENARLLGFSEDKIDKIISFLIEKAKENIPVSEILKQATYA